jgi:hypothetical protein
LVYEYARPREAVLKRLHEQVGKIGERRFVQVRINDQNAADGGPENLPNGRERVERTASGYETALSGSNSRKVAEDGVSSPSLHIHDGPCMWAKRFVSASRID